MLIDMHIHTYRHSGCSMLDPVDLVHRAEERGLAGIVITEHDFVWSRREIEGLKEETGTGLLILRGQEVSSYDGHMLVYGCYKNLDYLSTEKLLDLVHKQEGVVIPSHPFRYGDFTVNSLETLKKQLSSFDGFEALNGNQSRTHNAFGMNAWEALGVTGIGGSDAHSLNMVGNYATEFENEIHDEEDLIKEIRAGRCRPVVLK